MRREFTGKHMVAVLVFGFGIVLAVNLTMASIARGTFSGVVVENSYVASQKFNGWIEEARRSERLGWEVALHRDEADRIVLIVRDVPLGARVQADLRRPLGDSKHITVQFDDDGNSRFVSNAPVPDGRWIVRLTIEHAGRRWTAERELA